MSAPRSVVLHPRSNTLALKACSINLLKKQKTNAAPNKLALESALRVQSLSIVSGSPYTSPSSTSKSTDGSQVNYKEENKQCKESHAIKISSSSVAQKQTNDSSQESEDGIQEEQEFKAVHKPAPVKSSPVAAPLKKKEAPPVKEEKEYPVPKNLTTTREHLANRKYFDSIRWFCVVRPQYQRNCGLASLTSVFNFLFSSVGYGTLSMVSQEEVMSAVGFKPPFDEIKFGAFAGNQRLFVWFRQLMKHFNVQGDCGYYYKPVGKGSKQAMYQSAKTVLPALKSDLKRDDFALVYHCYNHYFCPVGYETSPVLPHEAYSPHIEGQTEHSLIIGDSSKKFKTLQTIPWQEVVKDLTMKNPRYFDVRRPQEGVQCKEQKQKGQSGVETNCHCLMYFRRNT